jgi:uncharacterized SAM-binding protein YcdF (DUF218 family)
LRPLRGRPLVRFCTWSFATASALLLGLFLWSLADVLLGAQNRFPNDAQADFALVPSGDAGQRSRRAAELFLEGRVDRILFTGKGYGGDAATVLARNVRRLGIPESRLLSETEATTTCQNFRNTAPILRAHRVESVVVVTDTFHSARVAWHARSEGFPKLAQLWIDPVSAGRHPWTVWVREALKLCSTRLMWVLSGIIGRQPDGWC